MRASLPRNRVLRILVGMGVPVGAILIVALCMISGSTPPCIFYELTGLYCAGCGSGRAMVELLQGHAYAAFRLQPLMILSLPFLLYGALKYYIAFVVGRDLLPMPEVRSRWFGIAVLLVLAAYWILRNIPVPPFTYLAPCVV